MTKRIFYKNMESTPVLEEFSNKHLEKIEKILENERTPIYIDLTLESMPTHAHHRVEMIVKTPNYDLVAHHEGPEMYQEIDRVADIMIHELRKAKARLVDEAKTKDSFRSA
ncbi:ribosome-associated translation inhibitor RaiA [Candidatus Dependentiae bacterium]|nr:ribosome-associated translation inhibitor RaiA [Candidatus Dependentiae bacterium]